MPVVSWSKRGGIGRWTARARRQESSRARRVPPDCRHGTSRHARVWRSGCRGHRRASRISPRSAFGGEPFASAGAAVPRRQARWPGRGLRRRARRTGDSGSRAATTPRSAVLRIQTGVDAPPNRYYTDWGLYPNQPYIIGPPWSAIVAYDLNKRNDQMESAARRRRESRGRGREECRRLHGRASRHDRDVDRIDLRRDDRRQGSRARRRDRQSSLDGELPAGSEGLPSMYE